MGGCSQETGDVIQKSRRGVAACVVVERSECSASVRREKAHNCVSVFIQWRVAGSERRSVGAPQPPAGPSIRGLAQSWESRAGRRLRGWEPVPPLLTRSMPGLKVWGGQGGSTHRWDMALRQVNLCTVWNFIYGNGQTSANRTAKSTTVHAQTVATNILLTLHQHEPTRTYPDPKACLNGNNVMVFTVPGLLHFTCRNNFSHIKKHKHIYWYESYGTLLFDFNVFMETTNE